MAHRNLHIYIDLFKKNRYTTLTKEIYMVKIPLRSPPLPSTDVLITQTNVKKIALKMMKNQLYPTCHMTENGEKIRVIMKKSLVEDI